MTFSPPNRRRLFCAIFGCIAFLCLSHAAHACSVPVFRYGLEHWNADPYRVVVLYQTSLNADQQKLAQLLKDGAARANVRVQVTDIVSYHKQYAGPNDDLMKHATPFPEPVIVVEPPTSAQGTPKVWSGPLTAANVAAVLDSPARQTIGTRLGEGESAVWVLLESGDKAADDAAAKLLEARLAYLSGVLELPKLDEQDIRNGLVSVPPDGLRLAFSVVRVSRQDPAEQVFTQMLLSVEPDLRDTVGPIAFPVFGQGRALYALVGKGIKHETIDEAASFLIGSCSCQVKEKNPGADLLMAVDWKKLMKDQATGLQDLPPASEIVGGMPETVKIAPETTTKSASRPRQGVLINRFFQIPMYPIFLVGGIVVLVVVAVLLGKKKGPSA